MIESAVECGLVAGVDPGAFSVTPLRFRKAHGSGSRRCKQTGNYLKPRRFLRLPTGESNVIHYSLDQHDAYAEVLRYIGQKLGYDVVNRR